MKDINLHKTTKSYYFKTITTKEELNTKDECEGYYITSGEKECRKILDSMKAQGITKKVALEGGETTLNRRAIETLKINYLVSPEKNSHKHNLKQRDSGFNHVLAKEAKKKNIAIIINLEELQKLEGTELSTRIAQLQQNINISKKAGNNILIANMNTTKKGIINEQGRKALGTTLGMNSKQTKNCTTF